MVRQPISSSHWRVGHSSQCCGLIPPDSLFSNHFWGSSCFRVYWKEIPLKVDNLDKRKENPKHANEKRMFNLMMFYTTTQKGTFPGPSFLLAAQRCSCSSWSTFRSAPVKGPKSAQGYLLCYVLPWTGFSPTTWKIEICIVCGQHRVFYASSTESGVGAHGLSWAREGSWSDVFALHSKWRISQVFSPTPVAIKPACISGLLIGFDGLFGEPIRG